MSHATSIDLDFAVAGRRVDGLLQRPDANTRSFSKDACRTASQINCLVLSLLFLLSLAFQLMMRSPTSTTSAPAPARSYQPLDFGDDIEDERKASGVADSLSLMLTRITRSARPFLSRCTMNRQPCNIPSRAASFPNHFRLQVPVLLLC